MRTYCRYGIKHQRINQSTYQAVKVNGFPSDHMYCNSFLFCKYTFRRPKKYTNLDLKLQFGCNCRLIDKQCKQCKRGNIRAIHDKMNIFFFVHSQDNLLQIVNLESFIVLIQLSEIKPRSQLFNDKPMNICLSQIRSKLLVTRWWTYSSSCLEAMLTRLPFCWLHLRLASGHVIPTSLVKIL